MSEILVLRLVHVVGGIFWAGSGLFTALFLFPALSSLGPAAGQLMVGLQKRRLFIALPLVATLTVLSGVRLMWIVSGGFAPAYFATGPGLTFTIGGGAALLAFAVGMLVSRPAASRAAALGGAFAAAADDASRARLAAERERAQKRAAAAGMVVLVLLVVASVAMAVGRYVR